MRRIAKGVMRHVIESADPFIVPVTHQGGDRVHDVRPLRTITAANRGELMLAAPELAPFLTEHANASRQRTMAADEPLPTVCAGVKGGHFSVVTPILAGVGGWAGQSEPRTGGEPLYTMTTKADTALVAPTLVQTGYGEREGQAPRALDLQPLGTVVAGGVKHAVAAASLVTLRNNMVGRPEPPPSPHRVGITHWPPPSSSRRTAGFTRAQATHAIRSAPSPPAAAAAPGHRSPDDQYQRALCRRRRPRSHHNQRGQPDPR